MPDLQINDEAAIRENVKYMEEGWNTKNAPLFAKSFAEDADYIVVNGTYIKGRKIIEEIHQQIFQTFFKDSMINLLVKQIRLLRPEVALVHVSGHNQTKEGAEIREWDLMVGLVMTKEAGQWQIASFQNTRVDNPPQ
jgi:uncharacterized protein (TIGR02246 family)